MCGGTKWIMRSSRTGNSRSGAGAPMASGSKNWRGSFTGHPSKSALLPFRGMQRPRQVLKRQVLKPMILKCLAAHEPWLRRRYAFAHHGAAQRPDAVDAGKDPSPRAPCTGRKSDSRLRLSRSTAKRAAADVGAAHACRSARASAPPTSPPRGAPRPRARRWSAASRKPRLRPCAPIGGMTCAASPTSAMRLAAKRRAVPTRAETGRGRLDSILPRIEWDARSISRAARLVERGERVGFRRIDHPDQARALARQRHQREWSVGGVEFGRGVAVRPRVAGTT